MTETLCDPVENLPNESHFRLYKEWSLGGAGLLITGNSVLELQNDLNVTISMLHRKCYGRPSISRMSSKCSAGFGRTTPNLPALGKVLHCESRLYDNCPAQSPRATVPK